MKKDLSEFVIVAKKDFQQKELERLGLTPEDEQHEQIIGYFCYLHRQKLIDDSILPEPDKNGNFFTHYFLDSIQPLLLFGFGHSDTLLSLNGNIGFPAIPIAIFRPDLKVTIVESDKTKLEFLNNFISELNMKNIEIISDISNIENRKFNYVVEHKIETIQKFTRVAKNYIDNTGRLYTYRTENFEEELGEITSNKEKEGVCVSEIAEYDLVNKFTGLNLVALDLS